ncbi:hypothetical protein [Salsuginibacillus kocurii]|nr:hypothetical protein [Salsuginibacillus kocurii]
MTVSEKKRMEDMQRKIEELNVEIKHLEQKSKNEFETLDTDSLFTEMYNM